MYIHYFRLQYTFCTEYRVSVPTSEYYILVRCGSLTDMCVLYVMVVMVTGAYCVCTVYISSLDHFSKVL